MTITSIAEKPKNLELNPPMASATVPLDIGVLLPSRGRPEKLFESIQSLVENADRPEKLHILVAVDEDDEKTIDAVRNKINSYLSESKVVFHGLTSARQGYANLHVYYNRLASLAHARWLMVWNDDAIMKTRGWDSKVLGYDGKFCLLKVKTHNDHPYSIFPIIPRDWFILVGSLGDHQMIDSTLSQIAYLLDIMVMVDIEVDHQRPDLTGEEPDLTHNERQLFDRNPDDLRDINHKDRIHWRYSTADRIAWYLKGKGSDLSFWSRVINGTQDPWEKMKKNDPNKLTGFQ